jgi:peptidoglycan-N-acetylglucosamine deacetylase
LKALERLSIPTTFYTEGYAAVVHPIEVKRWADAGHEIALHGWKHEIWQSIQSEERERRLIDLGMTAMTELLGDAKPVGFRPPGFKINPWTERILEDHGIKYISIVDKRDQSFADKFPDLGIKYPDGEDVPIMNLKRQPVSDYQTDAYLIDRRYGGLLGKADAETGYEMAYQMAIEHERAKPNDPWIFVAHPLISGNRAWGAFEKFVDRLHAEFGSSNFRTARSVLLQN